MKDDAVEKGEKNHIFREVWENFTYIWVCVVSSSLYHLYYYEVSLVTTGRIAWGGESNSPPLCDRDRPPNCDDDFTTRIFRKDRIIPTYQHYSE